MKMNRKQTIWLRVAQRAVTETDDRMGRDDVEKRHRWSHPDVIIRLKADRAVSLAGKHDMLQGAIMIILQHYGYGVAALRYTPIAEPRADKRSKAQKEANNKTIPMFGDE